MKLSKVDYHDVVETLGEERFHMPFDASDAHRVVNCERDFVKVKDEIINNFGDVEISFYPDAPWFGKIEIEDEKYREALNKYLTEKSAWCAEYGCD